MRIHENPIVAPQSQIKQKMTDKIWEKKNHTFKLKLRKFGIIFYIEMVCTIEKQCLSFYDQSICVCCMLITLFFHFVGLHIFLSDIHFIPSYIVFECFLFFSFQNEWDTSNLFVYVWHSGSIIICMRRVVCLPLIRNNLFI